MSKSNFRLIDIFIHLFKMESEPIILVFHLETELNNY